MDLLFMNLSPGLFWTRLGYLDSTVGYCAFEMCIRSVLKHILFITMFMAAPLKRKHLCPDHQEKHYLLFYFLSG